jgi:NAD(P)-dependent dehydrogenase (short-subunit alcohol dehydrogenase family)
LLKKQKIQDASSVLFISSIAAHIGVAGVAGYSGSKAALLAMMRCLAMEVVKRKIRVNCLSPSLVETPLFEAMELQSGTSSMEQKRKDHPLGFGKPEDIANASIFFLSEASRWITGTTLVMDGGLTIS